MKIYTCASKIVAFTLALVFLMAVGVWAANQSITGTIAENDAGKIIIAADDGEDYLVEGKDLSEMIGQSVKVTGTLTEQGGTKAIKVMKVEEVKE